MKKGTPTSSRCCKNIVALYPVQVYGRVRPLQKAGSPTPCAVVKNDKTITLSQPESHQAQRRDRRGYNYTFKLAFGPEAQQWEVYHQVARPLVEQLFDNVNSLLFAYGVTGSGKTYTMTGDGQNTGIMPLCLDTIFRAIADCQADKYVFKPNNSNGFTFQSADAARAERRLEVEKRWTEHKKVWHFAECSMLKGQRIKALDEDNMYAVFVSYYEVYNNSVFDLLEKEAMHKAPQSKVIRVDEERNVYVHGVTEVEVKSVSEAMDVFQSGQKRKRMGHTLLNAESSRSHCVFNIRLVQAPTDSQGEAMLLEDSRIMVTKLSLVDLAGSERSARTKNTGAKLREAGNINNSLLTLRTCLDYLRENNKGGQLKKVPYRDSKITLLFKNYFAGEGQISMIVCINPAPEEYEENVQVLKFAEITQELVLAKSTPLKITDIGLPPGRRKASRIFRTAQDRLQKSGYTEAKDIQLDVDLVYSMDWQFPKYDLDSPNADKVIAELTELLKDRIAARRLLVDELENNLSKFRLRLVETELDMHEWRCQIATMDLTSEESVDEAQALRIILQQAEDNAKDMREMLANKDKPKPGRKDRRRHLKRRSRQSGGDQKTDLNRTLNNTKEFEDRIEVECLLLKSAQKPKRQVAQQQRSKSMENLKAYAAQYCDVVKRQDGGLPLFVKKASYIEKRAKGDVLRRSKSLNLVTGDSFLCKMLELCKLFNKTNF